MSPAARGAVVWRGWELLACSGRPVGLPSSCSSRAGPEVGVRVFPATVEFPQPGVSARGASTLGLCQSPPGLPARCVGTLRVLGSHAGPEHVPTAPLGRGTSRETPWGCREDPPCLPLPALFAGTHVGVSHGGVGRWRRGRSHALSRARAQTGAAATGKVLPVTGVCSCPGWNWLPAGRPEPRFRAAVGPGQSGVVQEAGGEESGPHSVRSRAAPEPGSDGQRPGEGAGVSLSLSLCDPWVEGTRNGGDRE